MRNLTRFAVVFLLAVLAATPGLAQTPAGDSWKVTIAPYFMGAAMNGTTAVKGEEITVDVPFSEILKNLQFGAMGLVVARKGAWGVAGDVIWMSLGANGTAPGPVGVTASADMNQGAFAFYGLRRLSATADVTFGARVNTMQANLRINGPLAVRSVDGSKTWVDPIAGAQFHTPDTGKRWHAQVYTEIGGFGAGSTFTWQLFPTIGVDVSKRASLEFGYRWLDIDYSSGDGATLFKYDVLTQGPVLGFAFKF
jgi:hypothetical protein